MHDRRIRLRHFECFVEVARLGSLSRAAERLALSQPAVSKTLAELERIAGARLMTRGRGGVLLTASGEALLPHAEAGLAGFEQALGAVGAARAQEAMAVTVGALPTVAAAILPEAVARFRSAHPGAHVTVRTGPNAHILELLRGGTLDMVVGRLAAPEQIEGLSFQHLYSEEVRFVVRPGHPLLDLDRLDPRRIRDFPVVVPDPGAIIRATVDRLLVRLGVTPPADAVETVSHAFGRVFTRRSDAVWIISHGVVAFDLREGMLAALPVPTGETRGAVGLTLRAEPERRPGPRHFAETIRAVAASR